MKRMLFSLAIVGVLAWADSRLITPAIAAEARQVMTTELSDDEFWAIIAKTARYEADTQRQAQELNSALSEMNPASIEAFERAFQRMERRAYSWDLWGAAYVIHGGASDDSFEYFERWLISKGKRVFEAAIANPDSLADLVAKNPGGPLEFEEFAYVAGDVWSKKTGIKLNDPSSKYPYTGAPPADKPSGRPFEESVAHLSARYPKLWKRFGHTPLY